MSPWLLMTQIAFAQEGPSVEDGPTSSEGSPSVVENSANTELDALEARLLGELPSDVISNTAYENNDLSGLIWIVPLFVFMIALIIWSKIRKTEPINPGEIRVISKNSVKLCKNCKLTMRHYFLSQIRRMRLALVSAVASWVCCTWRLSKSV